MASLRDTQALFWRLIAAPEGVADGLRRLDMKPADLAAVISGDARLDAVARLDIYAEMYFWRLHDILREEHAALAVALGAAAFRNLVTDYLLACPSRHPSVRNVGARLPAFVAGHALAAERPWLGELAALERARLEVFDGPDAEPLTVEALRALPPDAFATLPLPLVPSHAILEATHAVDDFWRAVERDGAGADDGDDPEPPPPPAPAPRTLLVWRDGVDVFLRALEPLERAALARARDGAPFGAVCELVAERLPLDEAAPAAFQMLARWAGDGIIARR